MVTVSGNILKETGITSSGSSEKQRECLKLILGQVTNAASFARKIVLGWDANIDLNKDNDMNVRYEIKNLADDYMEPRTHKTLVTDKVVFN